MLWPHTFITWIHIYFHVPRIPAEEEMAAHSSNLAWEIPWTEEPGGFQYMGSQESDTTERLNNDLNDLEFSLHTSTEY